MLLQLQNLHSEASKIRFEANNTLQTYETYAKGTSSHIHNPTSQKTPYSQIPNTGVQAIDTYKATRSLIQAGETVMNQNKSALE